MTHQLDMHKIEQQANELLNVRLESVRALAQSRSALEAQRTALREAEADDAQKFEDALTAGWSDRELRALGLASAPSKPRTRTPRGTRARTPKATENTADTYVPSGHEQPNADADI